MAEIYRRNGKFDLALDNLKKAESMVQDSMEVPYNIAAVYQAQGRYDEAAQILQDLVKKTDKPDNSYSQSEKNNRSVFLERLGTVYRDNNNEQLALETFRKMLVLGDDNAERGYQQIIDTYREAKQWQKATDAAKEATQKLPNDRGLKMVYAAQLADLGQVDAGMDQVKSLLKGTAEDRDVYINLAQMYSRLKRWSEAERGSRQGGPRFPPRLKTRNTSSSCADPTSSVRRNTIRRKKYFAKCWPAILKTPLCSIISDTCWPTAARSWMKPSL